MSTLPAGESHWVAAAARPLTHTCQAVARRAGASRREPPALTATPLHQGSGALRLLALARALSASRTLCNRRTLPTQRVRSSIPLADVRPPHQTDKHGVWASCLRVLHNADLSPCAATTWTYPSQQMFYNAMRRKGWSPREEDMPRYAPSTRHPSRLSHSASSSVVAIHNTVNERAWREVLAWEAMHQRCVVTSARVYSPDLAAATVSASVRGWCASSGGRRITAPRRGC